MFLSNVTTPAATSLLPETHIAVLPVRRIVSGMEEGWHLLRTEQGTMPRAVNFISGPSRTADIEQTIVIGAHGPYRVHIVLCDKAGARCALDRSQLAGYCNL
jgi:L-lactate dehydrogenase complex protein LldG